VKELLIGTELALSEIAERAGFNAAYLSAVFRANEGILPSEYRRRYGRPSTTDSR
jgi:transcriptional regulator GlxA family with amidase domain